MNYHRIRLLSSLNYEETRKLMLTYHGCKKDYRPYCIRHIICRISERRRDSRYNLTDLNAVKLGSLMV